MTTTTVAHKYILAGDKEEAEQIAADIEWQEKEEIEDVDYCAEERPITDAKGRYVHTANGIGRIDNGEYVEEFNHND